MNNKKLRYALDYWLRIQSDKAIELAKFISVKDEQIQAGFEQLCESEQFGDSASEALKAYYYMLEDVAHDLLYAETFHRAICHYFGSLEEAHQMAEAETETAVETGLQK